MAGGALGHVLQRTTSFSLTSQQLFIGSLAYSALVLSLLVGENGYPRVISLLCLKETEIALRVSIKAIVVCLVFSILARYPVPRMATLAALGGRHSLSHRGTQLGSGGRIAKHFAPPFPNAAP